MLKQLYNPLSNKFDLVRSSGTQTRVIPVTADMTTAQFREEGTNLQWIVEAFSVENGIYTPVVISYSKSVNGNYTVIDFSWNTAFGGEIHVIYGVGKFVPQVNIPEYYYRNYQGEKLVYPKDTGKDFDIYAVMPKNCLFMFYNCTSLTTIPLLDTSKVTSMESMFSGCTSLTTIPLLDTSKVTNMYNMFHNCSSLTTIPQLDTSNVTGWISSMFYNCTSLTTIPLLDTSKVTSTIRMFYSCTSLTTIPLLDTSNVTDMAYMFYSCTSLTTIPQLDTSKVTNMYNMFHNCSSLTTIPLLDTSNVTGNMTSAFKGCAALESCQLLNLRTNISFSDSPLLSLESIQFMIQNSYSATNPANLKAFTMTLHPDTLAKVQADTTVYEWNGQSYTGLITLATAMQITIQ